MPRPGPRGTAACMVEGQSNEAHTRSGLTRSVVAVIAIALCVVSCGTPAPVAVPTASTTPTVAPVATAPPPRVVSTVASEAMLTITYDRPMKHGLACGGQGFAAGPKNTIDAFETNSAGRYYTSTDADFNDFLGFMWVASLNADCSGVTF